MRLGVVGMIYVTLSGLCAMCVVVPGLRFGRVRGLRFTPGCSYISLSG